MVNYLHERYVFIMKLAVLLDNDLIDAIMIWKCKEATQLIVNLWIIQNNGLK